MNDTVTLAEASRFTGYAKNTLLRHIQIGKLSAVRNDNGSYSIKKSDLERLYSTNPNELEELRRDRAYWKATAERLLAVVETLSGERK